MFDSRATDTEFLDLPDCDPTLAADSFRFIHIVNTRFGGIGIVRRFLAAEALARPAGTPLRILDIGSGSCDIPLAVNRWARTRGIPLHFTCLELADHAANIARRQLVQAADPAIQLLQQDVFTHQPDQPYDYALASMCFHHFTDAQILTLLQKLRSCVRHGVLINDLRRSPLAYIAAKLLLTATLASSGVRHDALLSIRRGFQVPELTSLLQQLPNATITVKAAPFFRIAAVIRFTTGELP